MPRDTPVHVALPQQPTNERQALLECLRHGQVDPRLLYRSPAQSRRWLAVSHRWAPFVNSKECRALYQRANVGFARSVDSELGLVALGCGDGSKDRQLLEQLHTHGVSLHFVPLDVSRELVLRAAEQARPFVPDQRIHPVMADVERSTGLRQWLDGTLGTDRKRGFTFFGMVPNLMPAAVVSTLDGLIRPGDLVLLSANMVRDGGDAAIREVLPQYDNPETCAWLLTLLEDFGVPPENYEFSFSIVEDPEHDGLRRIEARVVFQRETRANVRGDTFDFCSGFVLRIFFSYRYTERQLEQLLSRIGVQKMDSWMLGNGEEGVFLCRRTD